MRQVSQFMRFLVSLPLSVLVYPFHFPPRSLHGGYVALDEPGSGVSVWACPRVPSASHLTMRWRLLGRFQVVIVIYNYYVLTACNRKCIVQVIVT